MSVSTDFSQHHQNTGGPSVAPVTKSRGPSSDGIILGLCKLQQVQILESPESIQLKWAQAMGKPPSPQEVLTGQGPSVSAPLEGQVLLVGTGGPFCKVSPGAQFEMSEDGLPLRRSKMGRQTQNKTPAGHAAEAEGGTGKGC